MNRRPLRIRPLDLISRFIGHEATAGFALVAAAALALVCSNTDGLASVYGDVLSLRVAVSIGDVGLAKPLILWINDGLMAIFFFLVGLEIKREALEGHLSSLDQVVLPAVAAAGGMAAPAAIYVSITSSAGNPELLRGWAIPAATDIAFALGALALLGSRVPLALKIFLLTLATLDDLGAIAIIAVFYTDNLSAHQLLLTGASLLVLALMNRLGVVRAAPYVFVGIALWIFVLKSGVHATLAGVALAFAIPLKGASDEPIIERIEETLHPYVAWGILPLFAFANAGVSLAEFSAEMLTHPLPLGIALGLLLGKPLGILGASALVVASGFARLPDDVRWSHMAGVSMLAGIGFTMSLFIGMLAFQSEEHIAGVKIGVIAGSLAAAFGGFVLLRLVSGKA